MYPDTKKFLKYASDYSLVMLTDVEKHNTVPILKILGIKKYFDVIACAENYILNKSKFKKPSIHFVKYALNQEKYKGSEKIIYVGDSHSDYLTTQNMKRAGIDCTFILIPRYAKTQGDIVVKSLTEAMYHIEKIIEKN